MDQKAEQGAPSARTPRCPSPICACCDELQRALALLAEEREPPNRTDRAWRDGVRAAVDWVQDAWERHGLVGADVIAVGLRALAEGNAAQPPSESLFSVLKALLEDMEDRYDPGSGTAWMGPHIVKARAALAKADGTAK